MTFLVTHSLPVMRRNYQITQHDSLFSHGTPLSSDATPNKTSIEIVGTSNFLISLNMSSLVFEDSIDPALS